MHQESLFAQDNADNTPLANRVRPTTNATSSARERFCATSSKMTKYLQ